MPPLTDVVTIPPEVTPEKVTTNIIDSSLRVQDEEAIEAEIRQVSEQEQNINRAS